MREQQISEGKVTMGSKGQQANVINHSKAKKPPRKPDASGAGARGLWVATLVLLLLGLGLSGELVRLHIEATGDAAYSSYCSVNETVSCDTVTRSEYSFAFGVPLSVWGVFGYTLMVIIAASGLRRRSRAAAELLVSFGAFNVLVTLALAAISHFLIHAWCLLCIGTYLVNFAVGVTTVALLRKEGGRFGFAALARLIRQHRGRAFAIAGVTGGVALALILLSPPVRQLPALEAPEPALPSGAAASTDAAATPSGARASTDETIPPLSPDAKIETGVTEEGLPWIGAADPVVTITEFFDYECSHCRQTFHGMHQLLELNPDRLRLVVRHFPLSPECNRSISRPMYQHSCSYAKLANCARQQEQFWEAHEYLFAHSRGEVEPAAFGDELSLDRAKLDACLDRDDAALNRDIEAGIALDLHGTPAFVIDGQVYLQRLPRQLASKLRNPPGWH